MCSVDFKEANDCMTFTSPNLWDTEEVCIYATQMFLSTPQFKAAQKLGEQDIITIQCHDVLDKPKGQET